MLRDWRFVVTAAIFFTGILLSCLETNAQSMPKDVAARTEIYAIPSLTISDQQFLTGDANGKQVTVAGEFRIAQGSGKLPVVVLMHGSSGVGAGMDPWVRHLQCDGHFDLRDRRLLRPRPDGGRPQPGPARPAQFHRRHLPLAGHPRQASARRSRPYRADGIFARRTGRALRQPRSLPQTLEQVRRAVRRLHSVLSGLLDDLRHRHRNRGASDPDLSWHAGRL